MLRRKRKETLSKAVARPRKCYALDCKGYVPHLYDLHCFAIEERRAERSRNATELKGTEWRSYGKAKQSLAKKGKGNDMSRNGKQRDREASNRYERTGNGTELIGTATKQHSNRKARRRDEKLSIAVPPTGTKATELRGTDQQRIETNS